MWLHCLRLSTFFVFDMTISNRYFHTWCFSVVAFSLIFPITWREDVTRIKSISNNSILQYKYMTELTDSWCDRWGNDSSIRLQCVHFLILKPNYFCILPIFRCSVDRFGYDRSFSLMDSTNIFTHHKKCNWNEIWCLKLMYNTSIILILIHLF